MTFLCPRSKMESLSGAATDPTVLKKNEQIGDVYANDVRLFVDNVLGAQRDPGNSTETGSANNKRVDANKDTSELLFHMNDNGELVEDPVLMATIQSVTEGQGNPTGTVIQTNRASDDQALSEAVPTGKEQATKVTSSGEIIQNVEKSTSKDATSTGANPTETNLMPRFMLPFASYKTGEAKLDSPSNKSDDRASVLGKDERSKKENKILLVRRCMPLKFSFVQVPESTKGTSSASNPVGSKDERAESEWREIVRSRLEETFCTSMERRGDARGTGPLLQ